MSRPPEIKRQWGQPSSLGGSAAEKKRRAQIEREHDEQAAKAARAGNVAKARAEAHLSARPTRSGQEIGFFASDEEGNTHSLSVLAGEGAPTITGGWAKIATIDRPGRVGYTVPTGYDPMTMTLQILFDNVIKRKDPGDIENEIKILEWMAGRFSGVESLGAPPTVEVFTVDETGKQVPLVPIQYQTVGNREQLWWISGIEFDENPLRDEGGGRRRQAAKVTLIEISTTQAAISVAEQVRKSVKGKYKYVYSSVAANTIHRIAKREHIPGKWKEILAANPKIVSADKELKNHTKIRIPKTAFKRVPR